MRARAEWCTTNPSMLVIAFFCSSDKCAIPPASPSEEMPITNSPPTACEFANADVVCKTSSLRPLNWEFVIVSRPLPLIAPACFRSKCWPSKMSSLGEVKNAQCSDGLSKTSCGCRTPFVSRTDELIDYKGLIAPWQDRGRLCQYRGWYELICSGGWCLQASWFGTAVMITACKNKLIMKRPS